MTTATSDTGTDRSELLEKVRTYMALRSEVMERGKELADMIKTRTIVVQATDGRCCELIRNVSCAGSYEIPVGVREVELLQE